MVVANGSADFGARRNKMYLNDGGVFTEVSGAPLIPEFLQQDVSRNAFIRDFNGDGYPDIYIINDSNSGGFAGTDKIYISQFTAGVLTGYSQENASRIPFGGDLGAACGGVSYDLDGDGDYDVYSGNYPGPSQDRALMNNGSGVLTDETGSLVPNDSDYTVDIALGDMNGDGKMDLLVSNDFDPNYIYYNDLNGNGSGLGDFKYTGSEQLLGTAGLGENSMEAADFNNDGRMDIYWSNRLSSGDRILINTGNGPNGHAQFSTVSGLPPIVNNVSRKASVADFNEDGRIDVFVASQSGGRPAVLRNTTVNGTVSFVDWTPASAIPSGSAMRGWHGGVADTAADGDIDIVIGGFSGDHLIENVDANTVQEGDLTGGVLPALWNLDAVAVYGSAGDSEVDEYVANGIGSGFITAVLNGPDDYRLEILNGGGIVVATSDRGGLGVEEALQVNTTSGNYTLRVTVLESAGTCGPPDFDGNCSVDFGDLVSLLAAWGCTDCPQDLDGGGAGFSDLVALLASWGPIEGGTGEYLLETLSRMN